MWGARGGGNSLSVFVFVCKAVVQECKIQMQNSNYEMSSGNKLSC